MSDLDDFVDGEIAAAGAAPPAWEIGTVRAIEAGAAADGFDLVTVDWNGTLLPVGRGSTYTPVVGHVVWMARKGPQLMIIDRAVGFPRTATPTRGDAG